MPAHIRRRNAAVLLTATALTLAMAAVGGADAASSGLNAATGASKVAGPKSAEKTDYDARVRTAPATQATIADRAARASSRRSTRRLRASLGREAIVEMDGLTGTPRMVARLDGFLTPRSTKPAVAVALGYVRTHLSALGLRSADLATLRLRRHYVDVAGIHHLSWTQSQGGLEVFGNGLQASVTKHGQLISLGGSPVSGLGAPKPLTTQVNSPGTAISLARRDLGDSAKPGSGDSARKVLFVTAAGTRVGWSVLTMSGAVPSQSVIDAATGRVLYRRSLRDDAAATAARKKRHPNSTGLAFTYFPGHRPGGRPVSVDFTDLGWLPKHADRLKGNNSHTYSDVNDDGAAQRREEVGPKRGQSWAYRLKPFHLASMSFCDNPYPCSWDPDVPFSWRANREQNATQVFFFVNNFHDHLERDPIGFTEAAGNFQQDNRSGNGAGGDAVDTQTDDGANTNGGLPDGDHIDNANMDTPPDGVAPVMQMYLQHQPGTTYPDGDPFSPTNVGDEADTVYHEYTHGLSNRLVIDAVGGSTLGNVQAGAMGEAWSDWYAMDYLVSHGLQKDKRGRVDVVLFQYDGEGVFLDRTEPIDCQAWSPAGTCPGGATGHIGGYTYADYSKVAGFPEVHSDGEIWAQTLWDLRRRLGSKVTESLVTRAMELSPANPSFLDERNAILLADAAIDGKRHHDAIWGVFARRGMGFFAGSFGADDAAPGADFHRPPTTNASGTIHGTVTEAGSGAPISGARVSLAFQGAPGVVNPSTTTAADGTYTLGPVPVGTYPKLVAGGSGFDGVVSDVTVEQGGTVKDFALQRDYAGSAGGAEVTDFSGPDFTAFGCGPSDAIDQNLATGWGSTTGDDNGTPTNVFVPKFMVVDMKQAVDIREFAVDPAATCGDGGSASTGAFRIETSPDGTTWTESAAGVFDVDDRGRLNPVAPVAGATGVRFVKFWIMGNQTPDFATNCPGGAFSGCSFSDVTELEVYGAPS